MKSNGNNWYSFIEIEAIEHNLTMIRHRYSRKRVYALKKMKKGVKATITKNHAVAVPTEYQEKHLYSLLNGYFEDIIKLAEQH